MSQPQGIGCRSAALSTGILLAAAVTMMLAGLSLAGGESCGGACQTIALTMLYAGGPVSALLGVFVGDVWLAWPLEVTLWVVIGFLAARWAERHDRRVVTVALTIIVIALAYGLVLSQFVELAV